MYFSTTKNDSISINKSTSTNNASSPVPDKVSPVSSPQQVTSQQPPRR